METIMEAIQYDGNEQKNIFEKVDFCADNLSWLYPSD